MTFLGKVIVAKADDDKKPEVTRLENMDTEFVSLVARGANRQSKMLVVKAAVCPACGATVKPTADGTCPKCGAAIAATKDDSAAAEPAAKAESPAPPDGAREGAESAPASDFLATLASASAQCEARLQLVELTREVELPPPAAPVAPPAVAKSAVPEVPVALPAPTPTPAEVALRKALEQSTTEIAQLRDELQRARQAEASAVAKANVLRTSVGTPSALRGAESVRKDATTSRPMWQQDLARVAAEDSKPGQ